MHKENFTERDIPYELLEKHGLSQAMIDDLPQSVMNKLLHGEYTPMLPLNFKTEAGDYQLMSRIALTRTANQDVRVILKPKIDTSCLGLYTQEQQELLKAGKTIIGMDPDDLRNGENNGKCFIQYDDESNQVLSVPTYAIGENIRTLTDVLGLDYDSIKNLQSGEPQTTEWMRSNQEKAALTIGIDLRKDLGIRIVTGNLQEYLDEDKDFKEKYNFGINGVWIASEDGKSGTYVSEDDYTEEIKEQMKLASQRNRESAQAGSIKL